MKTQYLDEEIKRLESLKNPIDEHVEQLKEFKAIKEALSIHSVSKSDIVGRNVVITNCIHGHEFNDGEKVRIIERNRNGLLASNLKGDEWFIYEDEYSVC